MVSHEMAVGTDITRVQRYFNAANELIDSFDYDEGTTTFTYDGNGNLTMQLLPGNPTQRLYYHYNQRNLLVKTEHQTGSGPAFPVAEYRYDGADNRLQQVDHTGSTPITITYTNDILGLSQVLVADDGTTQTTHLFGLDLISQQTGSETRTLLADGLGSIRTEMVGDSIETLTTYEPFGKVIAQTGSDGTVYGFTGEQEDVATGLVYLRGRYYSPALKIFLSRDPFPGVPTIPATLHPYTYVHNNPVNLTDPSGEFVPQVVVGVVAAVAVIIVIYVAQDAIRDILTPAIPAMSRAISDFADECIDVVTEAEDVFEEWANSQKPFFEEKLIDVLPGPSSFPLPETPTPPTPTPSPTPQPKLKLYHYTDAVGFSGIMSSGYIKWTDYDIYDDDDGTIFNWNGVNFTDISPEEVRAFPTVAEGRWELAHYLYLWKEPWAFDKTEYWIGVEINKNEVVPVTDPNMYPPYNSFEGRPYYIYPSTTFWLTGRNVTCGRTGDPTPFSTCIGLLPPGG